MIISKNIYLRNLNKNDINQRYINWLNDKEINRYLEARFTEHTIKSELLYLKKIQKNKNEFLFGIFLKNKLHIGNLKVGPINFIHKITEISYLIGDKNYLKKGYAIESLNVIENYLFNNLKLEKIYAGVYSNNIASIKLLKKAGYLLEVQRRKHFIYNNKRIDSFEFGKLKKINKVFFK